MKNEEEPLELGWFVVKQPDELQLRNGITWAQARENEEQYFIETNYWNDLSFHWHDHLGTMNLVRKLSNTLSELIAKRSVAAVLYCYIRT